jgi:hypothetical protein
MFDRSSWYRSKRRVASHRLPAPGLADLEKSLTIEAVPLQVYVHSTDETLSWIGGGQAGAESPAIELSLGTAMPEWPEWQPPSDSIRQFGLSLDELVRTGSYAGDSVSDCSASLLTCSVIGSVIQPKDRTNELLENIRRLPTVGNNLQDRFIADLDQELDDDAQAPIPEGIQRNCNDCSDEAANAGGTLPRPPSPLLANTRSSLGKCHDLQKSPRELRQIQREMRRLFGKVPSLPTWTIPRIGRSRSIRSESPQGGPRQRLVRRQTNNTARHDGGGASSLCSDDDFSSLRRRILMHSHKHSASDSHLLESSQDRNHQELKASSSLMASRAPWHKPSIPESDSSTAVQHPWKQPEGKGAGPGARVLSRRREINTTAPVPRYLRRH